jgi:hypothetical protein
MIVGFLSVGRTPPCPEDRNRSSSPSGPCETSSPLNLPCVLVLKLSDARARGRICAVNAWLTILTSAAVGVLVSGAVSLIGQYLERRARRDELLLTKACEMAVRRTDIALQVAQDADAGVSLLDDVTNAETYFRWLKSLLDTGELPPDADKGRRKPPT